MKLIVIWLLTSGVMMPLLSLFFAKLKFFPKIIRDRDAALLAVIAGFILVGLLVAAGVFLFLWRGFLFLQNQPVFGHALTVYTLEAGLAIVFSLLVLTSISSGLVLFFRSHELSFLMARPLSPAALFSYGFLKNYLLASWPVAVLAIPALLALGISHAQGMLFYAVAGTGMLLFSVGAVAVGTFLLFGAAFVIPRMNRFYALLVIALPFFTAAYFFAQSIVPVHFEDLFRADVIEEEVVSTVDIERNFRWWPSHGYVTLVRTALSRDFNAAARIAAAQGVFALATFGLLVLLARAAYYALWSKLQETTFVAHARSSRPAVRVKPLPFLFWGVIAAKDAAALVRNASNLYSIGFLLFLLFIYLAAIARVAGSEGAGVMEHFALVMTLTVAIVGYFAAIFALRFVFPAVSREGRSAWVLWSSPFPLSKMIWAKLFLYGIFFSLLCEALFLFVVSFLVIPPLLLAALSLTVLVMVITLCALALGIGTALPDFRYDDPERLSTTPGGLVMVFGAIFYIGMVSALAYLMLQGLSVWAMVPAALVLSGVIITVSLQFALSRVRYIR